jgi:PAS domain S-box-containing protein
LSDPNRPDNPIIYVNAAFEKLSGHAASVGLGQNCRFMQGEDRSQAAVAELCAAIAARTAATVTLTNYRAGGTEFRNRAIVVPVHDADGDIFAFVGIQFEVEEGVSAPTKAEHFDARLDKMQHRVKNHLQMVASLIRLQSDAASPQRTYDMLSHRVEALALLYEEFNQPPREGQMRYDVVSAGSYVSRVASTVGSLDGRRNLRLNIDVDMVYMRTDPAAQLGLLTSEILSNTLRHAFDGWIEDGWIEGVATVSLKQQGGDRVHLTVADDGVGMDGMDWPAEGNLGARIARGLVKALGGNLNVISVEGGLIVTVDFDNAVDTSLEEDGTRILVDVDGSRAGEKDTPRLR